jgi:hypothetical protein
MAKIIRKQLISSQLPMNRKQFFLQVTFIAMSEDNSNRREIGETEAYTINFFFPKCK